MNNSPAGKKAAWIAYAPFVGFLIAYFINQDKKYAFTTWHIKNMFGLFLMFFISLVIQSQVNLRAGDLLWVICLVLWIYCWIMAFQNKEKGIPFLSQKFQDWFTFLD